MDLSYAAAVRLGVDRTGTARVELEAVGPGAAASQDRAPVAAASAAIRSQAPRSALIQAASFSEKSNAQRLVDRLQEGGVAQVDIDHVEVDGRDLWRVRIGPVDADDIDGVLARLRGLGVLNPRVSSQ